MATKLSDNEMMIVHEAGITVLNKSLITRYNKKESGLSGVRINLTYDGQNYRYKGVTGVVHEIDKARNIATPKYL